MIDNVQIIENTEQAQKRVWLYVVCRYLLFDKRND